jgi:hypothetical protein
MKVGFIGLGQMGSGMAASLLKAGHEVIVYNRTPAKAEPLIAQGARAVASIADACREGAVITMLANDNAVEGVVLGKGGIIDTLPKGGIHEHDQCRAVGGARDGACERRPAFRRGAGLWAPGRRCGRSAVRCCGRIRGRARRGNSSLRCDRTENFRYLRDAKGR